MRKEQARDISQARRDEHRAQMRQKHCLEEANGALRHAKYEHSAEKELDAGGQVIRFNRARFRELVVSGFFKNIRRYHARLAYRAALRRGVLPVYGHPFRPVFNTFGMPIYNHMPGHFGYHPCTYNYGIHPFHHYRGSMPYYGNSHYWHPDGYF